MEEVRVSRECWAGLDECVRLTNGDVELVAATQVGPRILSYSLSDGENVFAVEEASLSDPVEGEWNVFGGHRLWHAPEHHERTYVPDNDPVECEEVAGGVHLVQPVESETGIRKELSVELAPSGSQVTVTHSLTNEGAWSVELSPWGVTVLDAGGRAVVPFEQGRDNPEPNRSLSLWPDASLADDRLHFTDEYVFVDQDTDAEPTKFGVTPTSGWAAYVADGTAFCKHFDLAAHDSYPDRGSAVEVYTDDAIFELESLAPLVELAPGETATYTETWHLFEDVSRPTSGEDVAAAPYPESV